MRGLRVSLEPAECGTSKGLRTLATIETTDTAGFEAATAAAVGSRALEQLDEATVTSLLEFRFHYLVNAGFGCTKAAVLAARTDVPLCELTELFTAPLGAVR